MTLRDNNDRNAKTGDSVPSVATCLLPALSERESEGLASGQMPMALGAPRPVLSEFASNGLIYRQVKRIKCVALYGVVGRSGRINGYEVVRIEVAPMAIFRGKQIPAREIYPKSEDFGSKGWYFKHREDAELRFNRVLEASILESQSRQGAILVPG